MQKQHTISIHLKQCIQIYTWTFMWASKIHTAKAEHNLYSARHILCKDVYSLYTWYVDVFYFGAKACCLLMSQDWYPQRRCLRNVHSLTRACCEVLSIFVCACIVYTNIYICVHIPIYIWFMYIDLWTYVHLHVYVYVHIQIDQNICIFIYIHTCTDMYVCTLYIYILDMYVYI